MTTDNLIGKITIFSPVQITDYESDILIQKSEIEAKFGVVPDFLSFGVNEYQIKHFLRKQDADVFDYVIRVPELLVGENIIDIYKSNVDYTSDDTFAMYQNFKYGVPNTWKTGSNNGTISTDSIWNNIVWFNGLNSGAGWFKDVGTDYIRHQTADGFLITDDASKNEENYGYTYEAVVAFYSSTFWTFGFSSRNAAVVGRDGLATNDNNGRTINGQSPSNSAITTTYPVETSAIFTQHKMSFEVYSNKVVYKAVRLDTNQEVFNVERTRTLSALNSPRNQLKWWGGSQQSRWYYFLKRKNNIGETYNVEFFDEPVEDT